MSNPTFILKNILNTSTSIVFSTTAGDSTTSIEASLSPNSRLHDNFTSGTADGTAVSGTVYYSFSRDNLLNNPTMEVNIKDYTLVSGTGSISTITRNSTNPLRDNADLKFETTVSGSVMSYVKTNTFDLEEDESYQLNFRGNADSAETINVALLDYAGNTLDSTSISVISGTATTYTWSPTDPSSSYTKAYLKITPQDVSTIYLDDIYFAQTDPVDGLSILNHNLYGCSLTLYSSDSPYLDGTFSTLIDPFTVNSSDNIFKVASASASTMYYVLKIENLQQVTKIGEMSIGESWTLTTNFIDGHDKNSQTVKFSENKTDTGVTIRKPKYSKYMLRAKLNYVSAAETAKYNRMVEEGKKNGIFYCFDIDTTPEDTYLLLCDAKMYTVSPYLIYTDLTFFMREA